MMKYFAEFPKILYNFNITGENRLVVVRDIALNVRFVQKLVEGIDFYNEYDIEDGETPQFIAEKVYKDPLLHWVIMVYNQRYDYFYDWPMDSDTLDAYITEKYGSGNENDQHIIFGNPHYEDANGNIFYKVNTQTGVDDSTSVPYAKVISNKDYEYKVNNSKRRIKLIDIRLINQVVDEFQSAFEVIQR